MRDHTSDLLGVLEGSFSATLYVDIYNGSERVQENLEVTSWNYDAALDATINVSGRLNITYQSVGGESLLPTGLDGDLSPFRASVYLTLQIDADSFSERIGLGWGKVISIPSGADYHYTDPTTGELRVYASDVEVEFQSLETNINAWGFRFPEQPASLSSIYDEIRRISQMPVTESITDTTIPKATVYEATDGGRLAAVQMLFKTLGGMGVVDSDGAWYCVPYTWPATIDATLVYAGDTATITDLPVAIDTDGVANVVVGSFQNPTTGAPIYAVAEVDPGSALSPDSVWGEHTRYITDDQVTTQAAADARVATELSTVTQSQRYQIEIECVVNPLLELGDMVSVTGYTRALTGRLVKYSLSNSATMKVTLEVKRDL
jgi:hypothetical protein